MRFQRLDLNLLVALDALLAEKSVSQAADRICLSQSATSSALGRLREYFEDDLLVLKGRQMVLTPRGEELIEPVRAVLEKIRTTIAIAPPFDPATSDRSIAIAASDYATEVLLSAAVQKLSEEAPHMQFEILPLTDNLTEKLERGQMDLLITIDSAISSEHPSEFLFEDDYVVVGWDDNPALKQPLTREMFFDMEHVVVRFGKSRAPSHVEHYLNDQSLIRKEQIAAPSFISVAGFVIGSNRIATMHRRLARRLARVLPLKVMPVPIEIPSVRLSVQWSSASCNDPAIEWMVDHLRDIAKEKAPSGVVHDGIDWGGDRKQRGAGGGVRPGVFG
ncbi:LysR family transcriptional regulator [Emcibacter nanhaiensis]|uniref:LysR family transcriptional regulator n=1 Tax=Emcibacter nanhaiensis TaxID=1505037 RepID=A0A501PF49_9PROT|nr:LysR family transcriptional regulator [Emcibacter nanhaiensis]TPD59043.1 LysR family transcriptional regulator [Emcibacter nanhaiensis]